MLGAALYLLFAERAKMTMKNRKIRWLGGLLISNVFMYRVVDHVYAYTPLDDEQTRETKKKSSRRCRFSSSRAISRMQCRDRLVKLLHISHTSGNVVISGFNVNARATQQKSIRRLGGSEFRINWRNETAKRDSRGILHLTLEKTGSAKLFFSFWWKTHLSWRLMECRSVQKKCSQPHYLNGFLWLWYLHRRTSTNAADAFVS